MNCFKGFPNENIWRDHSSPKKVKNTEIPKGDICILYKKREERKIMNNEETVEQEIYLLGEKKEI